MKLPNGGKAIVEIEKLRDYCLNPAHPRGRHKVRVFVFASGDHCAAKFACVKPSFGASANGEPASPGFADEYGLRYVIDFEMVGPSGKGTLRSSWIIRKNEKIPRLTSCYVL